MNAPAAVLTRGRSPFVAEDLVLPMLEDVLTVAWIRDGLDEAVTHRKGVAVIGPKGAGKSMALDRAVDDFNEAESAAATETSGEHVERSVVVIQSPQSGRRTEIIGAIWRRLFGMDQLRKQRGKLKQPELLFQELVEQLMQRHIAALVFDEAENLSDAGIRVIRDLISTTERLSKERRYHRDGYRTAGIGVLLVGTEELVLQMVRSQEVGRRWISIHEVGLLAPAEAASVYMRFLPAFQKQALAVGVEAWEHTISMQVCQGLPIPIGFVETHTREYVRRMMAEDPAVRDPAALPFDEEMFAQTLNGIERPRRHHGLDR